MVPGRDTRNSAFRFRNGVSFWKSDDRLQVRSTNCQSQFDRASQRRVNGFDFASSEVNEALVCQLHQCKFIEDAHNVMLFGGHGTGKIHIATALGVQAIEHHLKRVRFFSTVELVNTLEQDNT